MSQQLVGWQQFTKRFPESRLLWSVGNSARAGVDVGGELRAYSLRGKVVIIHEYSGGNGWTAYVDPFTTLDVDQTFDAIDKHAK